MSRGVVLGSAPIVPRPVPPPRGRVRQLRWLLALALLSTSAHFAHNFVRAELYPPVPLIFPTAQSYRVGIVLTWPVGTVAALWGYRQYRRGAIRSATWALMAYAPLGMTSVGHYLGGHPHLVPAVFHATMFTDFLTGSAVLAFALRERAELRRGGST